MSATTIINCDICSKVIAGGTWEDAPSSGTFTLSAPAQKNESRSWEHLCYACRTDLVQVINDFETARSQGAKSS